MKKIIKLKEQDIHKIVKRVIKENSYFSPIDGRGRKNKDVGRIIKKTYQKRDGERITKYFYVSQKNPDFKIVLCGIFEGFTHLVNNPNRLVSIEWEGMGIPGGSQPNSPCTSPVELQMKVYVEPEKEDVDDWWNNEITDEMEIKYGDKIGNAIDGRCPMKSNVYHEPSNTCIWWEDSKKFDEWWHSKHIHPK